MFAIGYVFGILTGLGLAVVIIVYAAESIKGGR